MKISSALINAPQKIYGGFTQPAYYYRDSESDNYGRSASPGNRLRGLGFIPGGLPSVGGGTIGGGTPPAGGSSATCTACPPNCTTTSQQTTYYAHKQKLSDTDVPVKVNLKRIKCEGNQGVPKPACEQNLIALKRSMGMNGLNGCSACSGGYSNRM